LIEDDAAYRGPLADLLGARCVGAWPSVEAALPALPAAAPAAILLDIDLPGQPGHTAVGRVLAAAPGAAIVMLTAHDRAELVFESLRAGAVGYLLKSTPPDELLAAVDEAIAGGAPMSPAIARLVVAHFRGGAAPVDPRAAQLAALTPRERELLALIEGGASDKAAAARLGIAHGTARNSLSAIYRKLRVSGRTEAILRARP
jgi:DNA-binding NarL/FixJ family response regulator